MMIKTYKSSRKGVTHTTLCENVQQIPRFNLIEDYQEREKITNICQHCLRNEQLDRIAEKKEIQKREEENMPNQEFVLNVINDMEHLFEDELVPCTALDRTLLKEYGFTAGNETLEKLIDNKKIKLIDYDGEYFIKIMGDD